MRELFIGSQGSLLPFLYFFPFSTLVYAFRKEVHFIGQKYFVYEGIL